MPDVFFNPLVWGEKMAEKKNRDTAKSLGEVYEKFIYRHVTESYNTDLGQKDPIRPRPVYREPVYEKPLEPVLIGCRYHMWNADSHLCIMCGMPQTQYIQEQNNAL